MPKLKITWSNDGGEMDSCIVDSPACDELGLPVSGELSINEALIRMIGSVPLYAGDTITIREWSE